MGITTKTRITPYQIILLLMLLLAWGFAFIPPGNGFDFVYDAYYAIAQSQRLSLGGVTPPLNSYLLFCFIKIFGNGYLAFQMYTAIIISIEIYLLYLLLRALNGNWIAYLITLVFSFPIFFFTIRINYNVTTTIFWLLTFLLYIYLLQSKDQRYLTVIGIVTGFALLNKWDILWLDLGLIISIISLKERNLLLSKHTFFAIIFAIIIFSPYLYWMYKHNFINLYYYTQYNHNTNKSILDYGIELVLAYESITIPALILGLIYFYRSKIENVNFSLAVSCTTLFILIWITKAPNYFVYPVYIILFIGGAKSIIFLYNRFQKKILQLTLIFYVLLIFAINSFQVSFYNNPLFSKTTTVNILKKYSHKTLDGHLIYQIGSKETVKQVSKIYHHLPKSQKNKVVIWTESYVIGSIIDYYKKEFELPTPISADQDWYFWGINHADNYSTFLYIGDLQFEASSPKPHLINLKNYFTNTHKVNTINVKGASKDLNSLNIWLLSGWKYKTSFSDSWSHFANMSQDQ